MSELTIIGEQPINKEPLLESLITAQAVATNLLNSEFGVYFTENNISQQEIGLSALRGLEPQHGLTKKFEKFSVAQEYNLINFIYLSYEYILDDCLKKFKVQLISNIHTREDYSNVFPGVQNFEYFKVSSFSDSKLSDKQKSIINEEITKVLQEVSNTNIPFMDYLKDKFDFYTVLEERLNLYLSKDLEILLKKQFIK